jgi:hydroxymethylpyrimidine pyrophosphatase-like HAD family hydrolase
MNNPTTSELELVEALPPASPQTEPSSTLGPLTIRLLPSESSFYNKFQWCLNPFPTVRQAIHHLEQQLDWLADTDRGWQQDEICKNIYLLGCAILDSVDDYLLGPKYEFSKVSAVIPMIGTAVSIAERFCKRMGQSSPRKLEILARWKQEWELALIQALKPFVRGDPPQEDNRTQMRNRISGLLAMNHLDSLLRKRLRIPGAFRSQDLTHFDFLALGRKFVARFPERGQPVLVLGIRTAGSYFAPLLRAYLERENYRDVESVTVRPKHGVSKLEGASLARCAAKGSLLLIVDEPVGSGNTLVKALQLARSFSVARQKIVILTPLHSSFSHLWKSNGVYCLFSDLAVLTLEPEAWYKWNRSDPATEELIKEYFQGRRMSVQSMRADSPLADQLNQHLEAVSDRKGHTRFKRVYEVKVSNDSGRQETRYVLGKGVGWGWLSYHAFLAGEHLAEFVPPVLGLRDGILYTEWQPESSMAMSEVERSQWMERAASYIAARARRLRLDADPASELIVDHRNNGLASLANNLIRAYGARPAPFLSRGRIYHELSRMLSPFPTLIDGNMRPVEWIRGNPLPVKVDFEHHGLGRTEMNMTDPAYDLADAILTWRLSCEEETKFINRYVEESGDVKVTDRLLINKLVAGFRALNAALANLEDPRLIHRNQEFNRDYIAAWNFLVLHTMRYCAEQCFRPYQLSWHGPVVSLDVDGVLDKQVIGFPSATWAGMQAVSLLHAHDFAVVLNTARSIAEVKQYCKHYGFLGGVAEYGAFAWDAISDQERILVSGESLRELQVLAEELRRIPGIFLNEDYQFSVRAYTFEGGVTKPVPKLVIQNLISQLRLERLNFHQTYTDTAVLAKETDKGKGLLALSDLAGQSDLQLLAIGDSEADLPMFAVAKSSFAPGHISCRSHAKALGCHIDGKPFQPGLLNIVRHIIHPDKDSCPRCLSAERPASASENLIFRVLKHADEGQMKRLARALFNRMVVRSFLAN